MKAIITIMIFALILSGCNAQMHLTELQTDACNTADASGTCETRLVDVGIVQPEECCQAIGKCCSRD
jgi:hypothetical protein